MRNRFTTVVSVLMSFLVMGQFTTIARAATQDTPMEAISPEDLMFMDVSVFTASKMDQLLRDAPATIYVVTAEDIKLSGATQLSEALQMVPGLNLRRGVAGSAHIGGIWGIMGVPTNKIVLLLNGMQWTQASYNDPLFSIPAVPLTDIEKIEVLEGPGSSLYGSNAVTGVINIITKKTKNTRGAQVSLTGGQYATYLGSLRYGGSVKDNLDYRVTLSYTQRDDFGTIPYAHESPSQSMSAENLALDYRINDNSSLSFLGGAIQMPYAQQEYETTGVTNYDDSHSEFLHLKYIINKPDVTIGASWLNNDNAKNAITFGNNTNTQFVQMGKIEVQNTLRPFTRNTLVWGVDTGQSLADAAMYNGKQYVSQSGIFFDDTYKITDWFTVNGGVRYSKTSVASDAVAVDRVSLMFYPWANHRVRLTQGTSYRDPSITEMYYTNRTTYRIPSGATLYYDVFSHSDLKPEKAESYEASYMGIIGNAGVTVSAYTMNVKDFISLQYTSFWAPGAPRRIDFVNGGEARIAGSEVEVQYLFTKWLSGKANYTNNCSREVAAPGKDFLTQTPQHMAGAQLTAKFNNRLTCNLSSNYVDQTVWKYNASWGGGGTADAYTITNLYVGYALSSRAEVSLAAADLFDTQYSEYPIAGLKIGRRITGTITYNF
jgi:iron complex outermembrane receptor protein